MTTFLDRPQDEVLNSVNLLLGIVLFMSPWSLGYTDQHTIAWNAWLCGGFVAGIVLLALTETWDWEEYSNLAVGVWIMVSPWALGFATMTAAMWTHLGIGFLVTALSGLGLWRLYHVEPQLDASPRP